MSEYQLVVRTRENIITSNPLPQIGDVQQAIEFGKQIAEGVENGAVIILEHGDDVSLIPSDAIEVVTVRKKPSP